MESTLDRRKFLGLGAAACGVLALRTAVPVLAARADSGPIDMRTCRQMTPLAMAEASPRSLQAWRYLLETAASLKDARVRQTVLEILDTPAPTLAVRLAEPQTRAAVFEALSAKGFLTGQTVASLLPPTTDPAKAPQPFRCAPGSGYASHHAFPGGLAIHTAGNIRNMLGLYENYRTTYGLSLDQDTSLAAQLLHDLHKPWVFPWQADGSLRAEQTLAATGEHHVLSVAESIVRKLPAEVIVAQACAHAHPGDPKDETLVVGWIQAAAILAGVDPVAAGLLAKDGKTLPEPRRLEGFLCHLGDHDFVLTVPANKWLLPVLADLARERYGIESPSSAEFNAFRNYLYAQATILGLYETYATSGKEGLAKAVATIVRPA